MNSVFHLPTTSRLYSNIKVHHPDGTLMFTCSQKRIDFYLKNDLAEKIGEKSYRLKFIPKGYGKHDIPFEISEKSNSCVVCASESDLTRHHVVPYCFRRVFPENLKRFNSYDVLLLCTKCHSEYEIIANNLKNRIFGDTQHIYHKECQTKTGRTLMIAKSLYKHGHLMPEGKKEKLKEELSSILQVDKALFSTDFLKDLISKNIDLFKEENSEVTKKRNFEAIQKFMGKEKLEEKDYRKFIIMWRKHFIEHAKPRNLSPYWKVENEKIS